MSDAVPAPEWTKTVLRVGEGDMPDYEKNTKVGEVDHFPILSGRWHFAYHECIIVLSARLAYPFSMAYVRVAPEPWGILLLLFLELAIIHTLHVNVKMAVLRGLVASCGSMSVVSRIRRI